MVRYMAIFAIFIVVVFLVGMIMELARVEWGVPITIVDFVFCTASAAMCFFILKGLFRKRHTISFSTKREMSKLLRSFFVFSAMAIPFGAWSVWNVWAGTVGAFDYFSGVRGAIHGYTIISLGFLFMIMWVRVLFTIISGLAANKRNDD